MSIEIKFFASLREKIGSESVSIEAASGMTVLDSWKRASGNSDYPVNTLCAINMEYARPNDPVQDGDEVAFFPPVTGGQE